MTDERTPKPHPTPGNEPQKDRGEESLPSASDGESLWRALFENAPYPIAVNRLSDGVCLAANPAFETVSGYSAAEVVGQPPSFLVAPGQDDLILQMRESLRRNGRLQNQEVCFQNREGVRRRVLFSAVACRLGSELCCVSTCLDEVGRDRVETALRRHEAVLASLFASTPAGVGLLVGRVFQEVNQALSRITGYSRDELLGMSTRLLYHDDNEFERVGHELYRVMQQDGVGILETRMRRKDGTPIDILLGASPFDPVDWSQGVTTTILDITKRKQAEDALRQSEQLWQAILTTSPAGILVTAADGRILAANERLARRFGTLPEELLGRAVQSLFPDEAVLKKRQEIIGRIMRQGTPETWEDQRGGFWLKNTVYPIFDQAGAVGKIIIMSEDITPQKIAEMRLLESEERFRQLAANVNEVFWIFEPGSRRFVYANPAFATVFGFPEEGVEIPFSALLQKVEAPSRAQVESLLTVGEPDFLEFPYPSPPGERRWIHARAFPVRGADGRIQRVVGLANDVTELKEAKQREQAQQEKLIQADKLASIGLLVSGVAHEVNNPNNLIMMNTGLIQVFWKDFSRRLLQAENPETVAGLPLAEAVEEFDRLVEGVMKGSARIQALIQELKNFARTEPGRMTEGVDLGQAVGNAAYLVGSLIRKSTRNYRESIETDLPKILGNLQKLEQVTVNLLTNACHALRDPGGEIAVRVFSDRANSGVVLEICDSGVGIPSEDLPRLMDPFFTTKQAQGGTGLGLSVSYGIVQEHGGQLVVESEPGQGTRVKVWLPAR